MPRAAKEIDHLWQTKYGDRIAAMSVRRRSYSEGIDRIAYHYDRLGMLERIKHWARVKTAFAHAMLDGLEFAKQQRQDTRTDRSVSSQDKWRDEIPA